MALAGVLTPVAAGIGLILTIVLLAGLSRLMILPFAVKAERDQIKCARSVGRDGRHQGALQGRSGRASRAPSAPSTSVTA